MGEIGFRADEITHRDTAFFHLFAAVRANIDKHLVKGHRLLLLLFAQRVRRDRADHARDFAPAAGTKGHAMIQHRLAPPAADGIEADKPLVGNMSHHKTHFVHVPDDGDFRAARAFAGDKTPQPVKADFISVFFEGIDKHIANFLLIPANCTAIAQCFQ
ncbi:hypothetical protein D3C71_1665450 [compost metagenome]